MDAVNVQDSGMTDEQIILGLMFGILVTNLFTYLVAEKQGYDKGLYNGLSARQSRTDKGRDNQTVKTGRTYGRYKKMETVGRKGNGKKARR